MQVCTFGDAGTEAEGDANKGVRDGGDTPMGPELETLLLLAMFSKSAKSLLFLLITGSTLSTSTHKFYNKKKEKQLTNNYSNTGKYITIFTKVIFLGAENE